jgi:hypothetical protein
MVNLCKKLGKTVNKTNNTKNQLPKNITTTK